MAADGDATSTKPATQGPPTSGQGPGAATGLQDVLLSGSLARLCAEAGQRQDSNLRISSSQVSGEILPWWQKVFGKRRRYNLWRVSSAIPAVFFPKPRAAVNLSLSPKIAWKDRGKKFLSLNMRILALIGLDVHLPGHNGKKCSCVVWHA